MSKHTNTVIDKIVNGTPAKAVSQTNKPAQVTAAIDGNPAQATVINILRDVGADLNPGAVALSRAAITAAGGNLPTNADDQFVALMGAALTNSRQAAKSVRNAATAIAYAVDLGYVDTLVGSNGKTYTSANALMKAVLPELSDSTIRAYLNVGKTFYLPAAKGTLNPALLPFAELEPGTATNATILANDAELTGVIPSLIGKYQSGKLTQKAVKELVREAKEAVASRKQATAKPTEQPEAAPIETAPTETVSETNKPTETALSETAPTESGNLNAALDKLVGIIRRVSVTGFETNDGGSGLEMRISDTDRSMVADIILSTKGNPREQWEVLNWLVGVIGG